MKRTNTRRDLADWSNRRNKKLLRFANQPAEIYPNPIILSVLKKNAILVASFPQQFQDLPCYHSARKNKDGLDTIKEYRAVVTFTLRGVYRQRNGQQATQLNQIPNTTKLFVKSLAHCIAHRVEPINQSESENCLVFILVSGRSLYLRPELYYFYFVSKVLGDVHTSVWACRQETPTVMISAASLVFVQP